MSTEPKVAKTHLVS